MDFPRGCLLPSQIEQGPNPRHSRLVLKFVVARNREMDLVQQCRHPNCLQRTQRGDTASNIQQRLVSLRARSKSGHAHFLSALV